ncbi:hypothetical protein [Cylindrospermum sp. FACHB-282]|uniref:hypothetical protein n=1 Tax=Cylindrospermum sp. FACHB-282 TaxID=2692794 RepID=UPI00168806DD|nr:hypothetical protein [Cylindrospermum sp. FACHB-282]MBD2384963.1 hypothetical protein [Cylindrospermum sp. FACHB-282]
MEKKKLLSWSIFPPIILKFNSVLRTQTSAKIIALMVVGVIVLGSGTGKSINTNLFGISPAVAQRISPSDVWRQVYQQLPDFPQENKYISKDSGKTAENDTLMSRLIRYHIYVKGRSPIYRLDWKLTLADYLNANEVMYETAYPGSDTLRVNPIDGDRTAIARLSRNQRNTLVQVLVNIFNPNSQNQLTPNPITTPSPNTSTTPPQPQRGGAELLK